MSELDGVVLSESEIFRTQQSLKQLGLITTSLIDERLIVFKLSELGQSYCLQSIYPNLALKNDEIEIFDSIREQANLSDVPFDDRSSIDEIWDVLKSDPPLAERLAHIAVSDNELSESEKSEVREKVALLSELLERQPLSNSANAQVKSYTQIIMIIADSPSSSRKDIAHYLNLICSVISSLSTAGTLGVAILTYIALK